MIAIRAGRADRDWEIDTVMRLKVGVSRKEATDREGSVGATCEIEVELPGGTAADELARIRDHWLSICENTVDDEIERLRGESAGMAAPSPGRSRPAPSRLNGTDTRGPAPTRRSREEDDEDNDVLDDEERPPIDGRQLLGWAAKQDPDAKGLVIAFGKKKGYPSKIVGWTDDQVRSAYRYARGRQVR